MRTPMIQLRGTVISREAILQATQITFQPFHINDLYYIKIVSPVFGATKNKSGRRVVHGYNKEQAEREVARLMKIANGGVDDGPILDDVPPVTEENIASPIDQMIDVEVTPDTIVDGTVANTIADDAHADNFITLHTLFTGAGGMNEQILLLPKWMVENIEASANQVRVVGQTVGYREGNNGVVSTLGFLVNTVNVNINVYGPKLRNHYALFVPGQHQGYLDTMDDDLKLLIRLAGQKTVGTDQE